MGLTMPETPERLAERLVEEGQKTVSFFQALSPTQWERVIYSQRPVWTAQHVLAHFVSAERALHSLIEDISTGGQGAPEGFDIDGFNLSEVADLVQLTTAELLEEFKAIRQANISLVRSIEQVALAQSGRHPFLGVVMLEDIIKMLYRHDQIHLRDMRRLLKPEAGEPAG
jgi:hypothetical protein